MNVKLVVASGKSAGKSIAVKGNKLLIGRAEECDVRPLSEEVSRRHCAIHIGPSGVTVEDLKSRNGTFLNGEKYLQQQKLLMVISFESEPLNSRHRLRCQCRQGASMMFLNGSPKMKILPRVATPPAFLGHPHPIQIPAIFIQMHRHFMRVKVPLLFQEIREP